MSVLKLDEPALAPALESLLELDQAVLDALPMGFYACDASGEIVRFNRRAIELWGRAPSLTDSAPRFCGSFRVESLDGEFIPPDQTPMARAVLAGESFENVEAFVENADGRRWVARVNVAPLRAADGSLTGAVNCFQDVTEDHEQRRALARTQRTFDLAMVASKMGTWRYTLADNICMYDENAQHLYGLSEARFLHDEDGVKEKFHADDMPLMWERVAAALDPNGDGLYSVEYRVKQIDGSWRWLSAWGQVEFEGQGASRKPIAIAGASRDLTERKRGEEREQVLMNELSHRVKNTMAIVQSLVSSSLRDAVDFESARTSVNARIASLATAHNVLTSRNGLSADIKDLVSRTVAPFEAGRFRIIGGSVDVSPQQTLAFALALHELATNAAKYGALSTREGRVDVRWRVQDSRLHLAWVESGGPSVAAPKRRGFGSRLIEEVLFGEWDGESGIDFAAGGVRCSIAITLASIG